MSGLNNGGPGSAALAILERALRDVGCTRRGSQWTCPAHEDRSPSLSVSHHNGRVLLHCFAGCTADEVRRALGLEWDDMFDRKDRGPTNYPARRAAGVPNSPSDPAVRLRGRFGLPTYDDLFWRQPEELIEAHFERLLRNPHRVPSSPPAGRSQRAGRPRPWTR